MTDQNGALPEHRQKQVEAGLATYQSVLAERDMLERQLYEAKAKIDSLDQQLSSMQGIVNMMESAYISSKADLEGRVRECQKERDDAVACRAAYETLFATIKAQLRVFALPSTPLVKEVVDGVYSNPDNSDLGALISKLDGGGQRPALPDPSAGQNQMAPRPPVLAHSQSVLGQRAGGPKVPGSRRPV